MAPAAQPLLLLLQLAALGPPGAAALRVEPGAGPARGPGLKCMVTDAAMVATRSRPQPLLMPWACPTFAQRLGGYFGTGKLPLDGAIWGGLAQRYPLVGRRAFEQAALPGGYAGARLRLRKFALQLVAGAPLEISVLGGSMTVGPWSQYLQAHLQSLGHHVTLHNLARSATGAEYAAHVVMSNSNISKSGLIIIDTSVNDWKDWHRANSGTLASQDSYDLLVHELLELPHRPAVIDLGTFHMTPHRDTIEKTRVRCTSSLTDFPHARATNFQLPIISFPDAVCTHGSGSWWFGNLHPNETTHDAIARTLVGVLGLEAAKACEPYGLRVADHPILPALRSSPFSECLRLRSRQDSDFTASSSAAEGDAFVQQHGAWQFARDLPTKPFGWLVQGSASAGSIISFKVNASQGGWIRMDYLSTYDKMGSVTCWVDGIRPEQGCGINAILRGGKFSVQRSAYIGLPKDLKATLLHCRAHNGKFKVMGMGSC